jgi:hypothetical protein
VSIRGFILCASFSCFLLSPAQGARGQVSNPEIQVAAALLAAPEDQRSQASVLGYDPSGKLIPLRRGENGLICLADDPEESGLSVACYHESLEPYMARGRELRGQGISDATARNEIRWREATEGTLAMPDTPATLFVLTGSGFDDETREVQDPYLRFVVYVPWATVESTGLPSQPLGPGSPWLMYPGTAGAHIMISPPRLPGG